MIRYRLLLAVGLAVAVALAAGCGGSHTVRLSHTARPIPGRRPAAVLLPSKCPLNQSQMGCSQKATPNLHRGAQLALPHLPLFPDVSMWQGAVNWSAVAAWQRSHGWHPEAAFKMGEVTLDPQAIRNAQQTAALGFWRVGYWYVRNTGCAHESGLIVWAAQRLGLRVVVLDIEVPEARGYAACLQGPLRSAGLSVIEYTSPGSNPDGSANPGLPMWVAAYGPSSPPCVFTCKVAVAGVQSILWWQFTDGQFGPVVDVPGVGKDDVSIDYEAGRVFGASSATPTPKPKPKPLVVIGGAQHYERYPGVERSTVQTWDRRGCRNPVRRAVCRSTRAHLLMLLGRDQALYRRDSRATRDALRLPGRIQGIVARAAHRPGIVKAWR